MANPQASYNYIYELSFDSATGGYLIIYGGDNNMTVGDGDADGQLSLSDPALITYTTFDYAFSANFAGYTINGDPVFLYDYYNTYFLPTNTPLSEGDTGTATPASSFTFCFCRGTLIRTPAGERSVESLQIGDQLLNAEGRAVAVKWIGRQRRHSLIAAAQHQLPIRIQAGALGNGLPQRDLYVSPDHALLVEGCLVHAAALVNGRSITRMRSWDGDVEYFHIETEAHELILAEGAAAETFIDNVSRETFDNYAEYAALYPHATPMVALDLPRICWARQLPGAISRKLETVADQLQGALAAAA